MHLSICPQDSGLVMAHRPYISSSNILDSYTSSQNECKSKWKKDKWIQSQRFCINESMFECLKWMNLCFLMTNILRFLKWILNINRYQLWATILIITLTYGEFKPIPFHLLIQLTISESGCSFLSHSSNINDLLEGLDGVLKDWLYGLHDTKSSFHIINLWLHSLDSFHFSCNFNEWLSII